MYRVGLGAGQSTRTHPQLTSLHKERRTRIENKKDPNSNMRKGSITKILMAS